ncbi:hypothetical protein L1987_43145 [Smallanthus sonchifolius]|uniref:Uncharacterized protein n=1 Tax=Smallanthus sonchifolius TaxID=185202 RepID=A0ACB9GLV3_9ASTR|nr:hypothetical protein L1987_43145 [Smallanthus sonchifolius]
MVKLATARESRLYGPGLSRNRAEYMNAGVYVFSTILLICGFILLLLKQPKSGLVVVLTGLTLIVAANIHDLIAHLAGIDYRIGLMELDIQLPLVEVAVPVVQALGGILFFLAILFLLIQGDKGHDWNRLEAHALNMLIASAVLWVVGSILNSCQIYERADGHVQILQQSVHIPFLMGSFLFLVGAIVNSREQVGYSRHGLHLLRRTWVWMGVFASLLLLIGGIANVVKVFKMLQMDRLRLEKLRGGAQERLSRAREGQTPFLRDERRRWPRHVETTEPPLPPEPTTPYKDVLVGKS